MPKSLNLSVARRVIALTESLNLKYFDTVSERKIRRMKPIVSALQDRVAHKGQNGRAGNPNRRLSAESEKHYIVRLNAP